MRHLIGLFKNDNIISFSVFDLKESQFVESGIRNATLEGFSLEDIIVTLVSEYPKGKFLTHNNEVIVMGAILKLGMRDKIVKLENGFKDSYQYGFRYSQRLKDKFYVTEEQRMVTDELLGSMNYFVDKFNGKHI